MTRITALNVLEQFGYQPSKELTDHISMLKEVMDSMAEAIHDEVAINGRVVVLGGALDMNGCLEFSTTLSSDLPRLNEDNLALFNKTPALLELHEAVWSVIGQCKMNLDDQDETAFLSVGALNCIHQKASLCHSQLI